MAVADKDAEYTYGMVLVYYTAKAVEWRPEAVEKEHMRKKDGRRATAKYKVVLLHTVYISALLCL